MDVTRFSLDAAAHPRRQRGSGDSRKEGRTEQDAQARLAKGSGSSSRECSKPESGRPRSRSRVASAKESPLPGAPHKPR